MGKIGKDQLKSLSNLNLQNVNLSRLISRVDEVHTITSLVGLNALLQKKIVFTYGMPYYAGWGLTHDKHQCPRRKRKLSIEELKVWFKSSFLSLIFILEILSITLKSCMYMYLLTFSGINFLLTSINS